MQHGYLLRAWEHWIEKEVHIKSMGILGDKAGI